MRTACPAVRLMLPVEVWCVIRPDAPLLSTIRVPSGYVRTKPQGFPPLLPSGSAEPWKASVSLTRILPSNRKLPPCCRPWAFDSARPCKGCWSHRLIS